VAHHLLLPLGGGPHRRYVLGLVLGTTVLSPAQAA
jgi:hypothetical protein